MEDENISGTKVRYGYDNNAYDEISLDDVHVKPDGNARSGSKAKISGRSLLVVLSILVTELCERLTYYSVVSNLVLYCTNYLKYPSFDAANINYVFTGTVYIFPVAGGYVADALAGRYNTILGSGFIYTLGLFLLPASAMDFSDMFEQDDDGSVFDLSLSTRRAFYLTGLVFIAIGTGGIKANVGPFGAQQVEKLGDEAVQTFFNWFYWFINMGALIAYSAVGYIQQEISFAWGFLVPLLSMVLALVIFLFSKNNYEHLPPQGSVLTTAFKICRAGCKKPANPGEKVKYFDKARTSHGGKFDDYTVDGLICVLRVLPTCVLVIVYWAIYSQMSSTFFLQGERLNVAVGNGKLPVAILNDFDTLAILLLIPIVDRLVYPFFTRIGRPLTHLKRIGIGFVLASVSMVAAGVLEIYRKDELRSSGGVIQELAGDDFNSSHISIFTQIPQFAFIGASEVFASISGLEFAFTQAPPSMQGVLTGLFFAASGIGNYLSSAILAIITAATESDPWLPDEINKGKLEYYFFLLGVLMLLNFIVFVFTSIVTSPSLPQMRHRQPVTSIL
ncbi:solute carrier family 15 member 4-like [Gigantopelta aegis]|uniref:solute carrier family 15 member 4-like n=1 Tax=Gigantopelta aegis TaxID=1735272 RepID=UPI001B88B681|nr:solute carrier family 15 member 4-like [Gigantopelta aegis]